MAFIKKMVKEHGLVLAIAIVVPGGEVLLLGKFMAKKYRQLKNRS